MPKAYWIAHVTVSDEKKYLNYRAIAPKAFDKYGARFLAKSDEASTLEGYKWQRHVVIEFASLHEALACYNSSEYNAARQLRHNACGTSVIIVEGLI